MGVGQGAVDAQMVGVGGVGGVYMLDFGKIPLYCISVCCAMLCVVW